MLLQGNKSAREQGNSGTREQDVIEEVLLDKEHYFECFEYNKNEENNVKVPISCDFYRGEEFVNFDISGFCQEKLQSYMIEYLASLLPIKFPLPIVVVPYYPYNRYYCTTCPELENDESCFYTTAGLNIEIPYYYFRSLIKLWDGYSNLDNYCGSYEVKEEIEFRLAACPILNDFISKKTVISPASNQQPATSNPKPETNN
ncbi:MAG: hypothetical protein ABIA04_00305 [Pseudomonadota bacterium]